MIKETEIPSLKESFKLFKRLVLLIKPYWKPIFKGLLIGIIVGVVGMIMPYMTKLLIDKVYPTQDVNLMHVIVFGVLAFSITSAIIRLIQGYYNLYFNSKMGQETSLMFFNHLQKLKIRFFDNHRVGEITSRFGDVSGSLQSVNKVFQTVFVNGVYLFLVPPFLILLNWKLALVSLISVPLTVIVITVTGKVIRKYWKKTSEAYAELNAFQIEMLSHIRTIKSLALEKHSYKSALQQMQNALQLQLRAGGWGQLVGLLNGILYAGNTALFTWLGWTFILSQQMTLGDFIAFQAYMGYFYSPITQFVGLFSEFQQSAVKLSRMFEYLDEETEISEVDPTSSDLSEYSQNVTIKLKNINFGYNPEKIILQNINLDFEPGNIYALLGASGSGKTSLLRLLNGMEIPQSGDVYLNETPITKIPLDQLRQIITIVWQEFSLFKGTLRDNLEIGLDAIEESKIKEVLEICELSEHIRSLKDGIDTEVAEWGSTLSGGQRQRVSIARALLRNSPVLVLDEATSNIDISTEKRLYNNLFDYCKEKTIIFVSHRTTCTKNADKIIMLDNGQISGIGFHDELLERNNVYRSMVENKNLPAFQKLKVIE